MSACAGLSRRTDGWQRRASRWRGALLTWVLALLAGCAAPGQQGSTDTPSLNRPLAALDVAANRFVHRPPKPHPFDPDNGMDGIETATLAVLNNPQLQAERGDAKVAGVQLFAAGLLPRPAVEHQPRSTLAQALVARVADRMAQAGAATGKVHLTLLWDEWQVAQAARLLFARRLTEQQTMNVLKGFDTLFQAQQRREQAAGSGVADTILAARLDLHRHMDSLRGESGRTRRTMNAVLGLAPDLNLPLVAGGEPPVWDSTQVSGLFKGLAGRRADLVALQVGERSDQRLLRETVLA
ncbi:MAG: hypothetical protein WCC36_10710, partial [Gammaproteobacteria bacterium]